MFAVHINTSDDKRFREDVVEFLTHVETWCRDIERQLRTLQDEQVDATELGNDVDRAFRDIRKLEDTVEAVERTVEEVKNLTVVVT